MCLTLWNMTAGCGAISAGRYEPIQQTCVWFCLQAHEIKASQLPLFIQDLINSL